MTVKEFCKQAQARLHGTEWTDKSKDAMQFVAKELEGVQFVFVQHFITRKAEDNSVVDCIKKFANANNPKEFVLIGRRQGKQFVSFNL